MNQDLVVALSVEVERIGAFFWGTSLLSIMALVLTGWLLSRLLLAGKRVAERLGVGHDHRLHIAVRWMNLLIFVAVSGLVLRRFFVAAPVMTGLVAITSAAGLMLALARPLQNAISGASLILRGRVREGDHIELDDHAGTVREVSLLRLRVRDADGQTILIPNRLLQDRVVTVSRKTHLVPVVAQVALSEPDRVAVDVARQSALLSPWRAPGTPVRAYMDGLTLVVELQTWSEASALPGRLALESSLDDQQTARADAKREVRTESKPLEQRP